MNKLKEFFYKNNKKDLNKWLHYFDIYEENFSKYKKRKITILEIGIAKGGSLRMWKNYFSSDSKIVGIDINPECKKFEKDNIKTYIGNQADVNFLGSVIKDIGKPDIIIDDGGHTSNQQILSFNYLFGHLNDKGTYLVEDTHTSYHSDFQDRQDGFTFMDYAKSLPDKLNLWYQYNDYKIYKKEIKEKINMPYLTKNTHKISFYNSIVVFEKRNVETPLSITK
jgi:cephalosporin hydroxylase|tara:strand:+ start:2366 stop:3034 length:669 start_codon:yes stop_codon:yes gene_type:complete